MQSYQFDNYIIQITEKIDFDEKLANYPDLLNGNFFRCEQVHDKQIHEWKNDWENCTKGDGLISDKKNIKLTVGVSDCNAVAIMGKDWFGILHAGWQGLKKGIIQNMFDKLILKGETEFQVFIGPSIRSCCYEVGEEFLKWVNQKYLQKNNIGRFQFDMITMILDILKNYNCYNIKIHGTCTKCSNNFFSYRNGDRINNFVIVNKN